jgi:hypothetical protein
MAEKKRHRGPLTEFVRARLLELTKGQEAKALAQSVGLSPSNISQVKDGTLGVGGKTLSRWAKLLGLTELELHMAAYEWWDKNGKQAADLAAASEDERSPELQGAIDMLQIAQHPTEAELRAILGHLGQSQIAGLETEEIFNVMLPFLARERRRKMDDKAAKRAEADVKKRTKRGAHREWKATSYEAGHGQEQGHAAGVKAEAAEQAKRNPPKPAKPARKKDAS